MKKFLKKFNDLQLTIFLEGIIGVVAIALCCIGFAYSRPGWAVGAATGTLFAMISTLTVFKGSDSATKESKPGLYLLFYFIRMVLFVGMVVFFVLMEYKAKIPAFYCGIWGFLIGYTPMFIILIVGQIKGNHNLDKKIQEKNKDE